MTDDQPQYYYCLRHHGVETLDGCKAADRLGPYPTAEQAAKAIQTAEARSEAFDEDPRFNDPDEDEDDRSSFNPFGP